MDKLHDYQGCTGRLHEFKEELRAKRAAWREARPGGFAQYIKDSIRPTNEQQDHAETGAPWSEENVDFSHIYRKKSRLELIRVSTAVMGIEFSYAAETAFVSPTLLKIGVQHQHMTLVWCLSPLVGFFLTPVLGSISDRCRSNFGRRRPFIIFLSLGVLLGLLLVPNGEDLGYMFGDPDPYMNGTYVALPHRSTAQVEIYERDEASNTTPPPGHPWGIFFTILGTVLLDFDADACQSPSRAYLLDVTLPEDHARGLSTFTIMAGLGGFMGYSLGGIDWDETAIGKAFGGHVRAVFSLITIIFIICVLCTITSFNEIPLWILEQEIEKQDPPLLNEHEKLSSERNSFDKIEMASYGAVEENDPLHVHDNVRRYTIPVTNHYDVLPGDNCAETSFMNENPIATKNANAIESDTITLETYLKSIVFMPQSLRIVCLTNLFCWMAHVCYSLYFTDFVGEAVFGGNPKAMEGSEEYKRYEEGVRFGCWGMAMYSLSCACYSLIIEKLIERFKARKVYVGGLLFYCSGMTLMALTKHRVGVIIFSWTAGVMYSTLFTMPYLLIAHYHSEGIFEIDDVGDTKQKKNIRGLGTDVAIVSSMVFLAQFILSICMGSIVSWSGTTTAVVGVAAFLSFFGAISASRVMYLDL
ncbi:proton-associated sugar transporter A [Toxorhynchites rutilus septentrionalis]|uniref:proton-associated sugar transporter A n=1 Tax=Toxorhynchites rutilus septentrionalis TaxID=329112 RepID=UPI0024796039|nr:proton-associated sugar transporter A [Toxorhynchites rutilus septentrionalis]